MHPRVAMQIPRHSKISITVEICTMLPDKATVAALKQLSGALGSPTSRRRMQPSNRTLLTALLYTGDVCSKKLWS